MDTTAKATISLITPSYRGDLERSALLFESVDKYVRSFEKHYVIVHDEDVALFQKFHDGRRVVLPASQFLPGWLREIPLVRWRNRRYWWSLRAKPVSGWHTQQLVKIQAAASLPEDFYCLVDSDNVFFREFDLAELTVPGRIPFHVDPNGVTIHRPLHMKWVRSAHRLLDLEEPSFPADDFIDQLIFWDQQTVRAMIRRIEELSGRDWAEALCRERDFSEYMIYGTFVASQDPIRRRYRTTAESLCRTYWDDDALGQSEVLALLNSASPHQVALCVQSFTATPPATIRSSLQDYAAGQAVPPAAMPARGRRAAAG